MTMKVKGKVFGVLLGMLLLSSCDTPAYGSTDTTWKDMTPWSYGPRCDIDIPVYYHDGDFNSGQIADMTRAIWNINNWMGARYTVAGAAWWTSENMPGNTVLVEARNPPAGSAYGNVAMQSGYFYKGNVRLGSQVMGLPTGFNGYNTGATFRGEVEHELSHAMAGVGDLYLDGDHHPTLLMGDGYKVHSESARGDLIGLVMKGCNRDKVAIANQLAGS